MMVSQVKEASSNEIWMSPPFHLPSAMPGSVSVKSYVGF